MRALRVGDGTTSLAEVPAPEAGGEALVRVVLSGICNTDLELARGYAGFRGTIGHEFVGVVEDPGGGPIAKGRRVVGEINAGCGACARCERGDPRHCATRTVLGILGKDGCFAEYVTLPIANLHPVPDELDDELAVFVEPLAAAFEILEQVRVEQGERAVVLGDGKLGLLAAQVLALAGARVLSVGRHPGKLALLRGRGIETVLESDWRAEPAPLVVDATGSARGFERAIAATLPRGTLVLKSTVAAPATVDLAPLVVHEIHVVGSRCGPFPPALHALEAATVDVTRLVSARVPLSAGVEALRRAAEPGARKVLIEIET
jgi:threonine dehydrogenase-like Zn-dependent dehydrogenase